VFHAFDDIFQNLHDLKSSHISIHGQLIVTGQDRSYITKSFKAFEQGIKIEIIDGQVIAHQLLAELAPYGGGNCIYDEDVYLTGEIVQKGEEFYIDSVKDCLVRRDDIKILINLND